MRETHATTCKPPEPAVCQWFIRHVCMDIIWSQFTSQGYHKTGPLAVYLDDK
jgi:hypothetical protein